MLLTEKDYHLVTAKVYYLEMRTRPNSVANIPENISFDLQQQPLDPEIYRDYYSNVGLNYNWLDRLAITNEALNTKINVANVEIYVMKVNNEEAGFAEFVLEKNYTEILYFGLFSSFVGKGFGKFFLQWVIGKAWSFGSEWIQLNTCSLDHPNALSVYQSQGFEIVRTAEEERKMLNREIA